MVISQAYPRLHIQIASVKRPAVDISLPVSHGATVATFASQERHSFLEAGGSVATCDPEPEMLWGNAMVKRHDASNCERNHIINDHSPKLSY